MRWTPEVRRLAPLLLLAACSKSPPPAAPAPDAAPPGPVVTRLRVIDATPPTHRPAALDAAALEGALKAALEGAGLTIEPGARSEDRWRVSVEARVVYGVALDDGLATAVQPGEGKAVWEMELKLRPPGTIEAMHGWLEAQDAAPFAGGDAAALRAALEARVKAPLPRLARGLKRQVEVLERDVPGLVDALSDEDADVRKAAAGRLGMLRATAAVPAIAARIEQEEDRAVLLRMVGALSEIGDDRAAEALIALANPRDRELLRAVIDALSVVGGKRVEDFFDILSSHDAADVRAMVQQARARLRRQP